MVVRRSDSRRRRLAIDPSIQLGDVEGVGPNLGKPRKQEKETPETTRSYGYGAERRSQMKTTDLIPKRFIACSLVVLALLACLAVINFAAQNAGEWQNAIGQSGQEAFSIRGTGTLSSWFSSFLLIMTGLASLQIYALRQHRCDDYVGTYRLWLWMAALFVIASVNCVVDLGGVLTSAFQSLAQQSLESRPWVPLVVKVGALSALVVRGLFEVKESRGTFALVVFVWVAYCSAAVLQLPVVSDQLVGMGSEMVAGNCFLFGTAALFYAHLIYGRFIFLHAHGLISVKPKAEKKKAAKSKANVGAEAKSKPKAKSKAKAASKKSPTKSKRKQGKTAEEEEAPAPVKIATKKVPEKKTTAKKNSAKTAPKVAPKATPENAPVLKGGSSSNAKSPTELLKEMADASRAKQSVETVEDYDYEEEGSVLKMSKAQKRKLRKQQKNQRRAA